MEDEPTDEKAGRLTFSGAGAARELGQTGADASEPGQVALKALLETWQDQHKKPLTVEASEHGYPVVDLTAESPDEAMSFLAALDASIHPVYHGMHNNEYRRDAGMPDVMPWSALDPALSHQADGRKAVYATKSLTGGLVHAVLEMKRADANPHSGEVYSLRPEPGLDGTASFIEVSPHLDEALRSGEERFTNGLLYVLPADKFTDNPKSNHEVAANEKVTPLTVIRVGRNLGAGIVAPEDRWVRED